MKVSVIITAHNEKRDLDVTATLAAYGSIRPHEIIIVDDKSDPPIDGRIACNIDRVRVIGSAKEQRGVSGSRNVGAHYATGDLLIFMDSHMRMPHWWLEPIIEAAQSNPSSILCPACHPFNYKWGSDMYACGARFDTEGESGKPGFEAIWKSWTKGSPPDICPCVMGACYIVPRFIWDRLGGFNPNFFGWGQDEQDLSLRVWMYGFEVRRIHAVAVAHKWDRTPIMDTDRDAHGNLRINGSWQKALTEQERLEQLPAGDYMNTWQPGFNAVVNCATLMPMPMFDRYRRVLETHYPDSKVWHRFFKAEHQDAIMAFREKVQRERVRSDAQIEQIIGPFYPKGAK